VVYPLLTNAEQAQDGSDTQIRIDVVSNSRTGFTRAYTAIPHG
jgi:hypothetical protein